MPKSRSRRAKTDAVTKPSRSREPARDRDADGPRRVFRAHITHLCELALGHEVEAFAFPGGSRRDSCRLTLADGRSVVATVRDEPARADLERRVLDALAPHGPPCPAVIAANRRTLIQEDRGSERLSVALHRADPVGATALLRNAADALIAVQRAGHAAGLQENVPLLGFATHWLEALIDRPIALGSLLGLKPPRPEIDDMLDLLAVLDPTFIKWDARPANAVVSNDGRVSWIDFEHCGARNPLDDLVWLLADEYTPLDPARDEAMVEEYLPRFGSSLPPALAPHYFWTMATLHGTHRLNLIIDSQQDEDGRGWRDPKLCVDRDSVGVSLHHALRQCDRLVHHSAQSSLTECLSPFYKKCRVAIAGLKSPGR